MTCAEVRDLLAEHALGTLDPATRARVEEHLAWCAGCRKEAAELAEGVAGLSLSLPADPPGELEDRVVSAVQARARRAPRRLRGLVAVGLAAALAAGSLAWGMALAGRQEPVDRAAAARDARTSLAEYRDFVLALGGSVEVAELDQQRGPAGGGAILFSEAEQGDFLVVVVGGLRTERGPYGVHLRSGGANLEVGRLESSGPGRWSLIHSFSRDVAGFEELVVEDRSGRRVLVGEFS
jgi:anti-sigma factor RsiW